MREQHSLHVLLYHNNIMSALFAELNQGHDMLEAELVLDGTTTTIPVQCCICSRLFLNEDGIEQEPMVFVVSKDPTSLPAMTQPVYGIHTACIPLYDEQLKLNDYSRLDAEEIEQQGQPSSSTYRHHFLDKYHKSKLQLIRKYENCIKLTILPILQDYIYPTPSFKRISQEVVTTLAKNEEGNTFLTSCIIKFPSTVSPYLKVVKELFTFPYGKGWFETAIKINVVKRNNTSEEAQLKEIAHSLQVTVNNRYKGGPNPFEIIAWGHKIKSQSITAVAAATTKSSIPQYETHWKVIISIRYEHEKLLSLLYDFYGAFLEPGQSVGDKYMTFERFFQSPDDFSKSFENVQKTPFAFQTLPGIQRMKHATWLASIQNYEKGVQEFISELMGILSTSSMSAEIIGPNLKGNSVTEKMSLTGESSLYLNINTQTLNNTHSLGANSEPTVLYCIAEDGSELYGYTPITTTTTANRPKYSGQHLPIYVPGQKTYNGEAMIQQGFELIQLEMYAELMKLNL